MKVVIDTDAGLDDAQAIMMMLGNPEVEILCITTVSGNTTVDHSTKNVMRILNTAKRQDIPVHRGCELPLMGEHIKSSCYHGNDGFGDNPELSDVDTSLVKEEHAVNKLIQISKECEGELTLVPLGPLTNIAMAIRLDKNFGKRLKVCYIMGGNYHGFGNSLPHGEFNFTYDPEAARIVLSELACPITLVCWDLCIKCKTTWKWRTDVLMTKNSKCVKLLDSAESSLRDRFYKESKDYFFADQLLAGVLLYPDIVTASESLPCCVVVDGQAKGLMVVDRRLPGEDEKSSHPFTKMNIITELDMEKFLKKMVHDIHSLS